MTASIHTTPVRALLLATLGVAISAVCLGCDSSPELTYRTPPEAELRIGAIHSLDGFDPGEGLRLSNDRRVAILEYAVVVLSAVELHACLPGEHPDATPDPPADRINFDVFDLLGGTAHAHTPGSSTRLGTPVARDLTTEAGRARIVGAVAPPLGRYCRIYGIMAPADDDLDNPTRLSVEQLRGHTLLLRGRWRSKSADPNTDWRPFELTSDATHIAEMTAINPNTGQSPIHFAQRSDVTLALLATHLDPTTFEGLLADLPNPTSSLADTILRRMADTLAIHEFE